MARFHGTEHGNSKIPELDRVLVERENISLADYLGMMRDEGRSFEAIAVDLFLLTDIRVAGFTIQRYCLDLKVAKKHLEETL